MNLYQQLAFLVQIAIFSLLQKEAVGQCETVVDGYLPESAPQKFPHPDQTDEARTFDECLDFVQNQVPNAKAMHWGQYGECIAYISFNDVDDRGTVGSKTCIFPPKAVNPADMAATYGDSCLTSFFNVFLQSSSEKLDRTNTMQECIEKGLASAEGIQVVTWSDAGRCKGYYGASASSVWIAPPGVPMANYGCIIDADFNAQYSG